MTLFFLLPAYNEAENIPSLLEKIRSFAKTCSHPCKVTLVDDGSFDGTGAAAERFKSDLSLSVIRHTQNRGLAEALRSGFRQILKTAQPDDFVITMDADNSHDPAAVSQMLEKSEGASVVASRYAEGGMEIGLARKRKILSSLCNALLKIAFPVQNVSDYTSGYRLLRAEPLKSLAQQTSHKYFAAQGFVATSELLINLARLGGTFKEVPLVLRYDLKKGRSKMRIIRTILDYAGLFLRRGKLV